MHVPDGFLSPPVAVATWALSSAGLAVALRAERRDPLPVSATVLGALSAFVFAAQMINVPVAPGTSGHLVGATLVAVLVGPARAVIVMASVLAIQALLFQDGGLTAYGLNLLSMGLTGAFTGYATAELVSRHRRGLAGLAAGAMAGSFVATVAAAAVTSLALASSGLYPLRGILPLMLVTHSAIGLLEAALTGGVLVTVLRWRPDLVAGLGGGGGARYPGAFVAGLLGVALFVAAFLAPFASRLPDGLEHTAQRLGFEARALPLMPGSLEGLLAWPGLPSVIVPAVAGVAGTLGVALLAWLATRGMSSRSDGAHD